METPGIFFIVIKNTRCLHIYLNLIIFNSLRLRRVIVDSKLKHYNDSVHIISKLLLVSQTLEIGDTWYLYGKF